MIRSWVDSKWEVYCSQLIVISPVYLSVDMDDYGASAPHSWLLFHGILTPLRNERSSELMCVVSL